MSSKNSDKTQQKPAPEPPQQLIDLPPKEVADQGGNLIKGGPAGHPWLKPLI